jgi:dienelactone hydrolase
MLTAGIALAAQEPEIVRFSPQGRPGTEITGYLFRPSQEGRAPAVVALHGCAGLFSPRRPERLAPRQYDWAERLTAAGYAVLFVDSFRSRGIESVCTTREHTEVVPRRRARDAVGAASWLTKQPFVDPERIALIGWSHGGSTALWAAARETASEGFEFRTAIAFYPGCRFVGWSTTWEPRVKVTILMGSEDDWTPPEPCRDLTQRFSKSIRMVEYPGAYHAFDSPNLPLQVREGLAYSAHGDGRAHLGTNPEARAGAIDEVAAILRAAFAGPRRS